MKGKWNRQGRAVTVIAATVAAVAVAGGAYAAIPSSFQSGSVITSCYAADGDVKVIDKEAGKTCPAGTTQLQWNQQGRTGPTGPRGSQGSPGPAYFIRSGKYAELVSSTSGTADTSYYAGPGTRWLKLYGVTDIRQCAVNATLVDPPPGTIVKRWNVDYADWFLMQAIDKNGAGVDLPMDVSASCPR